MLILEDVFSTLHFLHVSTVDGSLNNYSFVSRGLTFLYLKHADSSQKYYTAVYRSRQESYKPGLSKVRFTLFL